MPNLSASGWGSLLSYKAAWTRNILFPLPPRRWWLMWLCLSFMILTSCYIRKPSLICDWPGFAQGDSWPNGCLTDENRSGWNLSHCHWALDHNFFLAYARCCSKKASLLFIFPSNTSASVPHHNLLYARSCEIKRHLNYEQLELLGSEFSSFFHCRLSPPKMYSWFTIWEFLKGWEEELFNISFTWDLWAY